MRKTSATFGNGVNLLTLANNKRLSKDAFDDLDQTGLLADLFEAANAGQLKVVDREAFRRLVKLPPLIPPLLNWLGTICVLATTTKFVADDNFKLKKDGGICSYIGNNFKMWFGGKVEEPIAQQTLCYAKLSRPSVDKLIITELGGEAKAETTLTEVYDLMVRQAKGQRGKLLTNGGPTSSMSATRLACFARSTRTGMATVGTSAHFPLRSSLRGTTVIRCSPVISN